MYRKFLKRLLDIILSLTALLILSPVFVMITFLLALAYRGAPFFIQWRPGLMERPFRVIKFKTMNDRYDAHGSPLPDEIRLTPFGKFIRRTSLDEIPQLLNVLAGNMSLIGPRPLLKEYLPLYSLEQRRRHEVRPGITGWAQVNGRNAISWDKKFEHDIWYVDHLSFLLDLKILWLTMKKVLMAEGIHSGTSATMERFKGNHSAVN